MENEILEDGLRPTGSQDEGHESLSQQIDKFDPSQSYDFLVSFARDKEFELSQEDVQKLVEKSFEHLTSLDFTFSEAIEFVQSVSHQSWKWEDGKEFLVEKIFRVLPGVYNRYPEMVHEIENLVGQEYYIRPEIFLDVVSKAYTDSDADAHLKTDLVHSFNYQYSFAGNGYDKTISNSLNFENPESYRQASELLHFLRNLATVGNGWQFSGDVTNRLEKVLKEKVDERKGSFLLNTRAKWLLKDLEDGYPQRHSVDDFSRLPYKISKDDWGYIENGAIYIIKAATNTQDIVELMGVINQELLHARPEKGKRKSDIVDKYIGKINEIKKQGVPLKGIERLNKKAKVEIIDYEHFMYPSNQIIFKNLLGVGVDGLTIDEQFELLHYLKDKTESEVGNIKPFFEKYGLTGMRTFLSLEHGRDFGDKIVELGENAPEVEVKKVFTLYSELVDKTEQVSDVLMAQAKFGERVSPELVLKIKDQILRKGRALLENAVQASPQEQSSQNITKLLEQYNADATLLFSVCKTLKSEGRSVDLALMANAEFEELPATELSPEDIAQMKEVYAANYRDFSMNARDSLLQGFDKAVSQPFTRFYVFKQGGKVLSFCRFDDRGNQKYFGSFNVEAAYHGSGLGDAMIQATLEKEAKETRILADCSSVLPIGSKYIESGFVATDAYDFEGMPSFAIRRDDGENGKFTYKNTPTEDLMKIILAGKLLENDARAVSAAEQKDISLAPLKDGFVITRYFRYPKEKGEWYAIFEKSA